MKKLLGRRSFLKFLGVSGLMAGALGTQLWRQAGARPSAEALSAWARLPYFSDGRFQSFVTEYPEKIRGGKWGLLRSLASRWHAPKAPLPRAVLGSGAFPAAPADFVLYWLGHSCAIFELAGVRLLIDPVFANASPWPGLVRRYCPPPLALRELPPIDAVLVTHDHYDHMERETIRYLADKTHFIVPLGNGARLRGWGVKAERITELGWGAAFRVGAATIIGERALHYSCRSLWDRDKTLWLSYVLRGGKKSIFWSGDTGYGSHFKRIYAEHGPFDLVCLEIDAWNPGWPDIHLFPEEVMRAARDLRAPRLLPIHWGVYDLAVHPWDESIRMLAALAEKAGLPLFTPIMGERSIPGQTRTRAWWNG